MIVQKGEKTQISEITSFRPSNLEIPQAATATSGGSAATTSQFMSLLMAQLTNQNPLEPLKDSEMLSQFAQLNSVEELKSIRAALTEVASANQSGYAASLIGKTVTANLANGKPLQGVVTGINIEGGKIYVQVGNQYALLSEVIEIKEK